MKYIKRRNLFLIFIFFIMQGFCVNAETNIGNQISNLSIYNESYYEKGDDKEKDREYQSDNLEVPTGAVNPEIKKRTLEVEELSNINYINIKQDIKVNVSPITAESSTTTGIPHDNHKPDRVIVPTVSGESIHTLSYSGVIINSPNYNYSPTHFWQIRPPPDYTKGDTSDRQFIQEMKDKKETVGSDIRVIKHPFVEDNTYIQGAGICTR